MTREKLSELCAEFIVAHKAVFDAEDDEIFDRNKDTVAGIEAARKWRAETYQAYLMARSEARAANGQQKPSL